MNWLLLVQALAPIIGPLITALIKQMAPKIPGPVLPVLATAIGAVTAGLGGADPVTAVALGGSGVAVREVVDQVKKTAK